MSLRFTVCLYNFTVFTTEGGVKFIVLKEGEGPLARDGDFLVVDFTGYEHSTKGCENRVSLPP